MFVYELLKEFIYDNKLLFTKYLIGFLITYSFEFIGIPIILGKFVTILKGNKKLNFNLNYDIFNSFKKNYIYNLIFLIILIYLFNFIFIHLINFVLSTLHSNLYVFIRNKLNSNLIRSRKVNFKELEVCKDLTSLDLTTKYTADYLDAIIADLIPLYIFSFIILLFFLYIDKNYFFILLIGFIILKIYINYRTQILSKTSDVKERVFLKVIKKNEHSLSNLSNILINNTTNYEIKKNNNMTNKFKNMTEDLYAVINNTTIVIRIIFIIFIAILLLLVIKNFSENKLSFQNMIIIIFVLTNYIIFFSNKIYKLVVNIKLLSQINVNREIFDLNLKNDIKHKKYKINLGNIEFRNIKFKYENNYIFNNLNLIINNNEKVGILGQSGSGKSTLIKLLLRFYKLDRGEILVDNININNYDVDYLRKNIYYINQNTTLFDETVYYNLSYGLNLDNKTIDEFLEKYDLYNVFSKLEKGLNNLCGPGGTNLSLGMQKIVFLVRGLLSIKNKNSKIIICDEPLTALDKETREKVIKMIISECIDKTLIIITHDTEIIPYMDRVVNLKDLG